ncbi:MAG: LLM class flavin-dependent oxidoreductase [Candidatus Ranarchaeia archaeon]
MKFGYAPLTNMPTQDMITLARLAETYGIDTLSLPTEGWNRSPFQTASAILHATEKIHAIVQCANTRLLHPVAIAIEGGTLADTAQGRTGIGICPGSPFALSQIGQAWEKPLKEIKEAVQAIKKLLTGEPVEYKSERITITNGLKLGWKPPAFPIFLTGAGPKMIKTAASIADGIILDDLPLKAIPVIEEWIEKGLAESGRTRKEFQLVNMMGVGVKIGDYDGIAGAKYFSVWQIGTKYEYIQDTLPEYAEDMKKVRDLLPNQPEAAKVITDRVMRQFGIIGTPDECVDTIKQYEAAGVDMINIMPPKGIPYDESIRVLGKHVISKL